MNSTFEDSEWTLESKTARDTLSRCKYSYTRLLYNAERKLQDEIGRRERVLIDATEDVLAAICTGIISVGFGIEYEWLSRWNTPSATASHPVLRNLTDLALSWYQVLEELWAWLGWAGDEVKCEISCSPDEYCYIPMWPVMFGSGSNMTRPPHHYSPNNGTRPSPPESEHPPYHYGSSPPTSRHPPGFSGLDRELWNPQCIKFQG